jgi:hypothetical protein
VWLPATPTLNSVPARVAPRLGSATILRRRCGRSTKNLKSETGHGSRPHQTEVDLWGLGGHRLLCGDSTVATAVERVLGGVAPHLMVTDPPYGVNYDPASASTRCRASGLCIVWLPATPTLNGLARPRDRRQGCGHDGQRLGVPTSPQPQNQTQPLAA